MAENKPEVVSVVDQLLEIGYTLKVYPLHPTSVLFILLSLANQE